MYKIIYLVAFGVVCSISLSSSYGIKRYPSNRMLDFNWPEPDEHITKFPHERYCHYYYMRQTDEIFSIRKCPPGEIFDYHIHECKEKHSAQCWSHHYGKHAIHDHIHSKWRKNFKCPFPNGNYPDIFDCDKYIVCLDGKPHNKHCPPNQQFDKNRRHCVYAAVCANSTDADLVTHMCPYPSGKFAHLENCSQYYRCHKNEPTVKTCEKNKLFHEEDRECKHKELVDCGDRPNPYYRETSTTVPIVKSVTTQDIYPSISSINTDSNTVDTETVRSSEQSVATANFDRTSVAKDKATAESIVQTETTENLNSSPSANTDESVVQSESSSNFYVSMSSKNRVESTTQPIVTDTSHSSMPSSSTAESTEKLKATAISKSAMPSLKTTESAVQTGSTDNSHSSQSSENIVQSTTTTTLVQN